MAVSSGCPEGNIVPRRGGGSEGIVRDASFDLTAFSEFQVAVRRNDSGIPGMGSMFWQITMKSGAPSSTPPLRDSRLDDHWRRLLEADSILAVDVMWQTSGLAGGLKKPRCFSIGPVSYQRAGAGRQAAETMCQNFLDEPTAFIQALAVSLLKVP